MKKTAVLMGSVLAAFSGGCGDRGDSPAEQTGTALSNLTCETVPTSDGHDIPVKFSVPAELAGFTGEIPVTFGVPFPEGVLADASHLLVYQDTSPTDCGRHAQFKATSYWDTDTGPGSVKWLLVDTIVSMVDGEIPATYLRYDTTSALVSASFPWTTGYAARVADGSSAPSAIDVSTLGAFKMQVRGGSLFDAQTGGGTNDFVVDQGEVRTTITTRGNYVSGSGQHIGDHVTRYTLFRDQPYVRVYHTMVWGRDNVPSAPTDEGGFDYNGEEIDYLAYDVPGFGGACSSVTVGVDGATDETPSCSSGTFKQSDINTIDKTVGGTTTNITGGLAGWLKLSKSAADDVFVGLRWARQQFPTSFVMNGATPQLRLLDQGTTNTWRDLISTELTADLWVAPPGSNYNTTVGFAKTYELWIWPQDGAAGGDVQNAFAQGGVFAYADPSFAVQAGLPTPMSACVDCVNYPTALDESTSTPTEVVENAIANNFTYMTRVGFMPTDPSPTTTRLGAFHFGDTFYEWGAGSPHFVQNRFWMNTGTGNSSLPWMLWLRSGMASYRDFGEANARHIMDLDTQHVRRHVDIPIPGTTTTTPAEYFPGGQFQYARFHGAFYNRTSSYAAYAGKTHETEGIALSYFITGYDRARDILLARAQGMTTSGVLPLLVADNVPGPSATYGGAEGPVGAYYTLGEVARLHEIVGDEVSLLTPTEDLLDAVLGIQAAGGISAFYFSQRQKLEASLLAAARVLPHRRQEIMAALAAWDRYNGSRSVIGPTGKVDGDRSLQATLANYDETGDVRILENAQAVVHAQAKTVHDSTTATGDGAGFAGSSNIIPSYIEMVVRDWLAVLARDPTLTTKLAPTSYLARTWGSNQARPASRFYTEKNIGELLYLFFDFGFDGAPTSRREVVVDVTSPLGAQASTDHCVRSNTWFWYDTLRGGVAPPPLAPGEPNETVCASPTESFVETVDGSEIPNGGVYRLDVDTELLGGAEFPFHPALEAFAVRSQPNSNISFDGGSGHRIELTSNGRLTARDKMSLQFRLKTSGSSVQVVLEQPYQYQIYTWNGHVYAYFYLTSGSSTLTKQVSRAFPSPWTDLEPYVSTITIDRMTGNVQLKLCDHLGCSIDSSSHPGHYVNTVSYGQPFTMGRQYSGANPFVGELDDVRVLPRAATGLEVAEYIGGTRWDIAERDVSMDGEAFLFDGNLGGLSGAGYTVVHGTAGTDFGYVSRSSPTRIARDAGMVQYDPSHDQRQYEDEPSHSCCLLGSAPSYGSPCNFLAAHPQSVGSVVGQRRHTSDDLGTCQQTTAPARFGFVDDDGHYLASSTISGSTFAGDVCTSGVDAEEGSLQTVLLSTNRTGDQAEFYGLGPLLAPRRDIWFDALTCEDRSNAITFGSSGSYTIPAFALGATDSTVSFKMRAFSGSATQYVFDKLYEMRAYTYAGRIYVDNYLIGSTPNLVVSAPYPIDQWITLTARSSFAGGVASSELFVNGVLVDKSSAAATGFNRPTPAHDMLLGSNGSGTSFDGMLDDVWVDDVVVPASEFVPTWYACEAGRTGTQVFRSFEDCPTGSGTSIVDRLSGAAAACPTTTPTPFCSL